MGIKLLNKFLKENCKSTNSIYTMHMSKLQGKRIVIDVSIYLYKYESDNTLIESIYTMISIFRHHNITPIFIFDGVAPTEKKELIESRLQKKRIAENEYYKLKEMSRECSDNTSEKNEIEEQMNSLKKKFVYMNKIKINKIKQLFDYYGMTYFDAPGEADQLCAWLVINKLAWACLSDDTDMFVYGCNRVLRYFSLINHNAVLYDYENILKELDVDHDVFKEICVLSGTDYGEGVGAGTLNIIKIMQLYKPYTMAMTMAMETTDTHKLCFYEWLSINSNIQINRDLLLKIKNMFDITKLDMSVLGAGVESRDKNNFNNKKIEKDHLYGLLKEDGFLFPSNMYKNKILV
jgi:5'-3' exonuclease